MVILSAAKVSLSYFSYCPQLKQPWPNIFMIKQPKPASTLCLLRNVGASLEVFLMRRRMGGAFSGMHVFPGGVVDPEDSMLDVEVSHPSMAMFANNQEFEGEHSATAYWAAAIRETFEESGLLLAYDKQGRFLGGEVGVFDIQRQQLNDKQLSFNDFLSEQGLTPAFDRLTYLSRRITPAFAPARFDTHFFLTVVPEGADGMPCNMELKDCFWITPEEALSRAKTDIEMVRPTLKTLELLLPFNRAEEAFDHFEHQWLSSR